MIVKLKLELKWSKICRIVTLPGDLNLVDLHNVLQAMFGFEHDHLWHFNDKEGNEYNTCRTPFGDALSMDTNGKLDPCCYAIEDVLPNPKDVIEYEYDYGDGWIVIVRRMSDPKSDEIACVKTVGTNAMEDIGGVPGLEEFTNALRRCKLKGAEDELIDDEDWPIAEWGYDDPEQRRKFLEGPSLEELTGLLREEVKIARERYERQKEETERKKLLRKIGRNNSCPCGSGKKFKKCCGK